MRIQDFELERWQSIWENKVELNISESGVLPLTVTELVEDADTLDKILRVRQGYPQTNGSEGLRSRIAAIYPEASAENVLVTCGGSEANFVSIWAVVEPGDEIVFMTPNYMQLAGLATAFGARVKPLPFREATHGDTTQWTIDPDELKHLVSNKTRMIAICNPNNPTGAILDASARAAVVGAASRVGAWILADEVYRGAEFEGGITPTFWGGYERVLCTAGLSKAYALPGLRTGWVVASPKMIERLWGYHDYTSIAPTVLTDKLASVALEPKRREWILARTRKILKQNYPILKHWLDARSDRFSHIPPKAGAIAWAGLRGGGNSAQIAEELRTKKSVLIVPGEQLGMSSYLRFGFGGDADHLERALKRIDEYFAEERQSRAASAEQS
jgi:aspartate/methionine/tyrosine aminotransferase